MDCENWNKVISYRAAMSLAAEMLEEEIITRKEYDRTDRIIAKSKGIDLSGICCRKPLIARGFRVTMAPTNEGGDALEENNYEN